MINIDKTYCASHNCVGACGRKKPDKIPDNITRLWWGYFCGEPVNEKD